MESKKLIIVTGANSGIGLEACKTLCSGGHKVIGTVRSEEKGQYCVQEVRSACPSGADIHYMLCDMSDLSSVKQFAADFKSTWLTDGATLDVLVNNAGGTPPESKQRLMNQHNPDMEETMVVNCIAPILLTDLLTEELKKTAAAKGEARVVMVNSSVVLMDSFMGIDPGSNADPQDPMMEKPGMHKGSMSAYKNSKSALMMCTLALVDEVKGTSVKVNSMCPGATLGTNLTKSYPACQRCCLTCLMYTCCYCAIKPHSNAAGGSYIVAMATEGRGESEGLFFVRGDMKSPPPEILDKSNQSSMLAVVRGHAK